MIDYSKIVTCKHCCQSPLYWDSYTRQDGEKSFRLADENGIQHNCKKKNTNGSKSVTCKHCNESGLRWVLVNNNGEIHSHG